MRGPVRLLVLGRQDPDENHWLFNKLTWLQNNIPQTNDCHQGVRTQIMSTYVQANFDQVGFFLYAPGPWFVQYVNTSCWRIVVLSIFRSVRIMTVLRSFSRHVSFFENILSHLRRQGCPKFGTRKDLEYQVIASQQETCLGGSIISLLFVQMVLTVKQALAGGKETSHFCPSLFCCGCHRASVPLRKGTSLNHQDPLLYTEQHALTFFPSFECFGKSEATCLIHYKACEAPFILFHCLTANSSQEKCKMINIIHKQHI